MKLQIGEYFQRRSQWRRRLICMLAAMLSCALSTQAQADVILPPIGGGGGGQFIARCPQTEFLTGFELGAGDDVDSIRPICVPTGPGQFHTYPVVYGGNGGGLQQLVCPNDAPIVIGMKVMAEGVETVIVNSIHLWCGVVATTQQLTALPNAVFDGPPAQHASGLFTLHRLKASADKQYCPPGLVAVGITGRSGIWLDAVGLICGAPVSMPYPPPANQPLAPRPPSKKTITEQLTTTTTTQSTGIAAALAGRSTTSTQVQSSSAAYSALSAGQATTPTPPPPPIVAGPEPAPPVVFSPPLLEDNAQLWACVDTAAGEANAGACSGAESAQAYCQLRGAQNGPDVLTADAQPDVPVRAVNGDLCQDANACQVVSQLQCDH